MFDIDQLAVRIPALLVAVTFHEFAHARVALAFGDHTAEQEGRVTLNPLAHLDPIGTIGMIIGSFGWGRPVPVNSSHMSHPRADFLVSAAGPLTNLAIACLGGALLWAIPWQAGLIPPSVGKFLLWFLIVLIELNIGLGLFNLLPIFPLDGSHMAENLLPLEQAYRFKQFSHAYGMPILFALIAFGAMTHFSPLHFVLDPPKRFLLRLLLPNYMLG